MTLQLSQNVRFQMDFVHAAAKILCRKMLISCQQNRVFRFYMQRTKLSSEGKGSRQKVL